LQDADFFVAIGNGVVRRKIQTMLEENGASVATLIHPRAVVAQDVSVGRGTVIMAGAVVNPGAVIGCGNIVNTCASVDHDCCIGDYIHIAVGARICGMVRLEDDSWIGAGAVIIQNLSVCAGCIIGAGAVVVKSITEQGTYVGVPAKKVK
jgi:sugar O-acyltransferase (sialic acid O-acetyltransferase NeuD family)